MRSDKDEAKRLRAKGNTYKEISAVLGVPKGTLSSWFKNEPWSIELKQRILRELGRSRLEAVNAERKKASAETRRAAEVEALQQFEQFQNQPLFLSGLTLYWSEGDMNSAYQVRMTNADPEKVALFRRFLLAYSNLKAKRLWASLIVYSDAIPSECLEYWSLEAGIQKSEFRKISTLRGQGSGKKSARGVCIYGVSSALLKTKMRVWIAELKKRLYS